MQPTRRDKGLCAGGGSGGGAALALRCHSEAVVLATCQASEVGCSAIRGELSFVVPALGGHSVQLCAVTGIPAERDDMRVAVHIGRQVFGWART